MTRSLSLFFFLMIRRPPRSTLFPYTTLFRSINRPQRTKRCAAENQSSAEAPHARIGHGTLARHPDPYSQLVGEPTARSPYQGAFRNPEHRTAAALWRLVSESSGTREAGVDGEWAEVTGWESRREALCVGSLR